jgi:hypothetical protein
MGPFSGKQMASARGNSKDAPLNECEQQRLRNIAQLKARLESLNIPNLSAALSKPKPQAKKRAKVISYINCSIAMSLLI